MRSVINTRLAVLLLASFVLSACGSGNAQIRAESSTGAVNVTLETHSSLSKLEGDTFGSLALEGAICIASDSKYIFEVANAVNDINANLSALPVFQPPVNHVLIQSEPPRLNGAVAVYLCDNLGQNAFTLYRSIYISNEFLGSLLAGAAEWGDKSLFQDALSYVIYHEFAHAGLNHSAVKVSDNGENRFDLPQEIEADSFAYDMMALTGRNLIGMVMAQSLENL